MTIYIGSKQILRTPTSDIVLTLEDCDFAATEDNSIGYSKGLNPPTNVSVNYNFFGTSIINNGRYQHKKKFIWNLYLNSEKTSILKALFEQQRFLIQSFQSELTSNSPSYPDYYIELIDGRIADIDRDSLSRSYDFASGMPTPALPSPGSIVSGYSHRWFRYLILIDNIEGINTSFMPLRGLSNVQISAVELDIATTAGFAPTDLL